MDCGVWTNRLSGIAPGHRYAGPKSGYLDPASSVSACIMPVHDLPVDWKRFKVNRNDIADAIPLVPCTWSAQEG